MTDTVKVTNISEKATEKDIWEFFSFSGEIKNIQIYKHSETNKQEAYVTFAEERAVDTAILLSDAMIIDSHVTIQPAERSAHSSLIDNNQTYNHAHTGEKSNRAQELIANMLAKGYVLGIDVMAKARDFDERHHITHKASELTTKASTTVTDFDRKVGITEKISAGAALANESLRSMDEKYHVTEKTKELFNVAETKVSEAGAALMKISLVSKTASWFSSSFGKVSKAAEEVTIKTREKINQSESERQDFASANIHHTSSNQSSFNFDQIEGHNPSSGIHGERVDLLSGEANEKITKPSSASEFDHSLSDQSDATKISYPAINKDEQPTSKMN